jgi:hypothetical protein
MTSLDSTVWKGIVFILVLSAFGIWDLLLFNSGGKPNTISHDLLVIAREYPILTLAVGIVLGHLFWPQCIEEILKPKP